MMCSKSDWAVIIPIFPHFGKFQLREVDFEVQGEAGDIKNSTSMPNYCDEPYGDLGICENKILSAWTEVWSGSYRARPSIVAPGGRSELIFDIFEILVGAGDINNSISVPNYYHTCLP